jgi:alcohol dehydrogenase (NADP+)
MMSHPMPGGGRMPALGLGTWKSSPGAVERAVAEALDVGYRHIDCAWIYENEQEIGRALGRAIDEGRVRRDELWITSKLWNDMHELPRVRPALERSLESLRLDYLDLYLMHWPVALRRGVLVPRRGEDFLTLEEVPLAETWAAMEDCVGAGLCRAIGVSNFSARKLAGILEAARVRPAVNQIEAHPFLQQPELLSYCRSEGVHVTAYSPLGSADRPSVLKRDREPSLLDDPIVGAIANKHARTPAQVLIAWSLGRDTSVIPKSVDPRRLRENFAAAEVRLDDEDMTRLARLDRHFRFLLGGFWTIPGSPYTLAGLWDE